MSDFRSDSRHSDTLLMHRSLDNIKRKLHLCPPKVLTVGKGRMSANAEPVPSRKLNSQAHRGLIARMSTASNVDRSDIRHESFFAGHTFTHVAVDIDHARPRMFAANEY